MTRSDETPGEASRQAARPMALGATVRGAGVEFAVWAPDAQSIEVLLGSAAIALQRGEDGVWSGLAPGIGSGARYRFRINHQDAFPDPYSRYQPDGPHGPSEVVDAAAFSWGDAGWPGLTMRGLVVYELHVGCYTADGTFDALIDDLDALKALGVTAIELMPVAEFPGSRNWGYDGVDLFAPSSRYGGPDGLKRLVNAAHQRGLGIILDVVYNHFGPDGNYLLQFAREYLTDRHMTPWGDAVNFDGPHSEMVRRFVIDNARYWLDEYHIDGLRLDATFAIVDQSPRHILEELASSARRSVGGRDVVLIAETYENDARYLRPASAGGFGFDAVWADDFHHVVHTIASHEHTGFYGDYSGTLDELARTIERGWLFEGQHSRHFGAPRGTSAADLQPCHLIYGIQNHDQVGNRAFGRRFSHLVGADAHRMWSALLLLLPYTPMLFMGQEFSASSRFYYFTDHKPDLGRDVTKGRRAEVISAAGLATAREQREIPDPQSEQTFLESKLNLAERDEGVGAEMYAMYAAILRLRRADAVLSRQSRERLRAMACNDQLLIVQMQHGRERRLLAVNTGVGIDATPKSLGIRRSTSLTAWRPVITTDDRQFGGGGDQIRFDGDLVSLPPQSVTWLEATVRPLPVRLAQRVWRAIADARGRER